MRRSSYGFALVVNSTVLKLESCPSLGCESSEPSSARNLSLFKGMILSVAAACLSFNQHIWGLLVGMQRQSLVLHMRDLKSVIAPALAFSMGKKVIPLGSMVP